MSQEKNKNLDLKNSTENISKSKNKKIDFVTELKEVDINKENILFNKLLKITEKIKIDKLIKSKITIESFIFSKYFYIHSDETKLLYATRSLLGFNLYLCEDDAYIGKLYANGFGTEYDFQFCKNFKIFNSSKFEVVYESHFFEKGRPRSFEIKLNGLDLLNKKPFFNYLTRTYNLNFSGRVTLPSVRNFQIIHHLEPTYITLTFGKETENSYILDYSHPWSILFAFCLGLTSLDHKFGCD